VSFSGVVLRKKKITEILLNKLVLHEIQLRDTSKGGKVKSHRFFLLITCFRKLAMIVAVKMEKSDSTVMTFINQYQVYNSQILGILLNRQDIINKRV